MTKHLTTHGNSAALVIDKPIMKLLNIDMKTPLEVTTDRTNLIISPVRNMSREKKFREVLRRVNEDHKHTLSRLA